MLIQQLTKTIFPFTGFKSIRRNLATSIEVPADTYAQRLHNLRKSSIDQGKEHFKIGERKIYFPSARVVLLRPNARHTPYQAKFIVPKSFNKLDLRDYLYHVYGLRALKVTTQLMHSKFARSLPAPYRARYRTPQIKKMTITMLDPFVWPQDEESVAFLESQKTLDRHTSNYHSDAIRLGSDKAKPSKAFGGIVDPEVAPTNFISQKAGRKMKNSKARDLDRVRKQEGSELIKRVLL